MVRLRREWNCERDDKIGSNSIIFKFSPPPPYMQSNSFGS